MVFDAQTTDDVNTNSSQFKKFLCLRLFIFSHKKILVHSPQEKKTQAHNWDGIVWEQEEEGRRGLFNAIIPDDDDDGNDDARRIRIGNKR